MKTKLTDLQKEKLKRFIVSLFWALCFYVGADALHMALVELSKH